jgi:molecular chaperone GrpE
MSEPINLQPNHNSLIEEEPVKLNPLSEEQDTSADTGSEILLVEQEFLDEKSDSLDEQIEVSPTQITEDRTEKTKSSDEVLSSATGQTKVSQSEIPVSQSEEQKLSNEDLSSANKQTKLSPTPIPVTQTGEQKLSNEESNSVDKQVNLEPIQQTLELLTKELSTLKTDFQTKIKYDSSKEQIITSLHSELQNHRDGFYFKILRSLALDILTLYDRLETVVNKQSDFSNDLTSDLRDFLEDIECILARHGFEIYQHDGDYDRKLQKVLKTESTEQVESDGSIAQRLKKGLQYEDRVVRPEVVTLYRYVASKS